MPGTSGRFAVAVSGGIDSMVLCELCLRAGLDFYLVHCNFQLRGDESDRDEAFVRTWAADHQVDILVRSFHTEAYAREKGLSVQEAARELRYQWFLQLKEEGQCQYTLLAHHANDTIETLLFNFLRGTGLHGLTGIPDKSGYFLRPLLRSKREEIVAFAREHGVNWVEDSSNQSSKYTRNFLRNEFIPEAKKVFPQVEDNLLANIDRYQRTERLYNHLVGGLIKKISKPLKGGVKIPVLQLKKYVLTSLIYEIIKTYGFSEKQVVEVEKLLESGTGKYIKNEHYRIIRHRNHLLIVPVSGRDQDFPVIEEGVSKVEFGDHYVLNIQRKLAKGLKLDKHPLVAQIDGRQLIFPLIIRKWRQGDYFYPLGLGKKKKLSRFFIDEKLSMIEKEDTWVLESAGRIVWVIGKRLDDRFRVRDTTKEVYIFNVSNP